MDRGLLFSHHVANTLGLHLILISDWSVSIGNLPVIYEMV